MKCFLFHNGNELNRLPKHDIWTNMSGLESVRMAWAAANSWRANGWVVNRVGYGLWKNDVFKHRLKHLNDCYPQIGLWRVLAWQCPCIVFQSDVFNQGFRPYDFPLSSKEFVSFASSFTTSAFYVPSRAVCHDIIRLLHAYDEGAHEELQSDFVSDETVLRAYLTQRTCLDLMDFPPNRDKLLVHYSRSTVQWFDKDLPLNE